MMKNAIRWLMLLTLFPSLSGCVAHKDTDTDSDINSDADDGTDSDTYPSSDNDGGTTCDGTTYLDNATGLYIACHPETGLVWLRCPIGQTWNPSSTTCEGEMSSLTYLDAEAACPEGFVWPSNDDMATVLCNFSEEMIDECPEFHYDSCTECSICAFMFSGDIGAYPSSDTYLSGDVYIYREFDFATGCATGDGDLGGTSGHFNVRCVESAE